eukprot:gene18295-13145_t
MSIGVYFLKLGIGFLFKLGKLGKLGSFVLESGIGFLLKLVICFLKLSNLTSEEPFSYDSNQAGSPNNNKKDADNLHLLSTSMANVRL